MNTVWTDGVLRFSYMDSTEVELVATMLAKPSVCAHVFFGPNTIEETRAFFLPLVEPMQESLQRDERPQCHVFTVREAATGDFVGECAVIPVMFGSGNFTIGYQLDEPFWRRGYGTRACEFVVWFGFTVLKAHRLSGDTLGSNAGSCRIMERCGFRREGVQRQYYFARGELHDNVLYGLLREESRPALARLSSAIVEIEGEPSVPT